MKLAVITDGSKPTNGMISLANAAYGRSPIHGQWLTLGFFQLENAGQGAIKDAARLQKRADFMQLHKIVRISH